MHVGGMDERPAGEAISRNDGNLQEDRHPARSISERNRLLRIIEGGTNEKMIFAAWKPGTRYGADAQKVADEISGIGDSATPAQILNKARDNKSELHKCFDWNDSEAAEKWRLHQARNIVCSLVYKEESKDAAPPVRLFFKTDSETGYKATSLILQNKDEYQKLLSRALAELNSFKAKYKTLSELDGVFDAIDQLAE
nr:MAG TPA: hypothetical protein [Caudoviricetes sp.]